jgi:hypothetical protein
MIKTEYLGWSALKSNYYQTSIDFELNFFSHGSIRCILQLSCLQIWILFTQDMLWHFEWKKSPRVLGFVGRCKRTVSIKMKFCYGELLCFSSNPHATLIAWSFAICLQEWESDPLTSWSFLICLYEWGSDPLTSWLQLETYHHSLASTADD